MNWRRAAREPVRAFSEAPERDVAVALVALAGLVAEPALSRNGAELSLAAVVLAGMTALPLVVRSRYPLGALTVVSAGLLACVAVFHPNVAAVGVEMLAVYTVRLQGHRVRSLAVGAAMAPVVTAAVAITSRSLGAGETVARLALVLAAPGGRGRPTRSTRPPPIRG